MKNNRVDPILEQLRQGKRCNYGFEDDEFSTIASIEQETDELYRYTRSINHKSDVVSPARYENKLLNERELRKLLNELSEEVLDHMSYKATDVINENTREKVDLIFSYLKQSPKVVYVVFKEVKDEPSGEHTMDFNSLFTDHSQAERLADYLKSKQGTQSYWKEVTLTLKREEEIEVAGELSELDRVNSKQILVTLLSKDTDQIRRFFDG